MTESEKARPAVLVPYPGPSADPEEQDVFVYLRPESNGLVVESTMLRIIRKNRDATRKIGLVYLANLPGEFITAGRIVERHYALKLKFAVLGADLFTPAMKEAFTRRFGVDFSSARIVGAFEALRLLSVSTAELFRLWVPDEDHLVVNGQSMKRVGDVFVVNYDIPSLLHRNTRETDIAVMLFRTALAYPEFRSIVTEMEKTLREERILPPGTPPSRVFHYSKGPFEQILDGTGYLYAPGGEPVPLENLTFMRYLAARGVGSAAVRRLLADPIVRYRSPEGGLAEDDIYSYTLGESYEGAYRKMESVEARVVIP